MEIVLAALLVYALLTFGAVLPNSWFVLVILWSGAISVYLVRAAFRHGWDRASLILFLCAFGVIALLPARLSVGLLGGIVAYCAVGKSERKTLFFFKILIGIGVFEASVGFFQYFVRPGWIFGYINQSYYVSGTLINPNHFAGILEMSIPVTIGMAYIAVRRFGDFARPYLFLLAGAYMGLALVFSKSRMGIFSFLATLLFLGVVLQVRGSQKKLGAALMLGMAGLVVAGALWTGVDAVVQRYAELVGQDALLREGRVLIFRDAIRMTLAHPWGVGIGNFQDVYRQYQTFRPDVLMDHAHNDYLETIAEWGFPLAVAFWAFVFFALIRSVRTFAFIESPERRGILLACMGAMFSILVHSLTDFNMQIPSNAMLFFSFMGISLAIPAVEDRTTDAGAGGFY